MSIAIVDYGSGNLRSAAKAFERVLHEQGAARTVAVTDDPATVAAAEHIVLPGVGAFADCRAGLEAIPGMIEALEQRIITQARPFLGICVGMQLMAACGLENGRHAGLGWIAGEVAPLEPAAPCAGPSADSIDAAAKAVLASRLPHMGWNELVLDCPEHPCWPGLPPATTRISCTPTAFAAPTLGISWPMPTTADRSPRRSAVPTWSAPSFTRRRARPPACA